MLRSLIIGGMIIGLMSSVAMADHRRSSSRISFSIGFSTGPHFRHTHAHFHQSFGHVPPSFYHHTRFHRPHRMHRPAPVVIVQPAPVVVYERPVVVYERPAVVYERPVVVYAQPRYPAYSHYDQPYRVASAHVGTTYQSAPVYSYRGGPRYQYERRTTYHYGY